MNKSEEDVVERIIYKHILPEAHDGRPFSFNIFWPARLSADVIEGPVSPRVFLMQSNPRPLLMLLSDALISASRRHAEVSM